MSDRVSNGFILTDPAIQSLFRLLHQFDDTNGNTKSEVFTDFVTGISASESELNADKTSVTDNLDSNTKATATELIADQLSDSFLFTCWALAKKNKRQLFYQRWNIVSLRCHN